jgi:hypothetical protein
MGTATAIPPPRVSPVSREALGLGRAAFAALHKLDTPQKIQAFVNAIPTNHEPDGETLLSVAGVMAQRRAHCIEAAFVAACALWIHGEPPLVMHLDCAASDDPHVVTLFRRHGAWGAISKSNGVHLRHRDAVYRSLRELAMSYVHEYYDRQGRKTLRSHSVAFDLRRLDPALWVSARGNCDAANARLAGLRHYALVAEQQRRAQSPRDAFERRVARLVEHTRPAPTPATRRVGAKRA